MTLVLGTRSELILRLQIGMSPDRSLGQEAKMKRTFLHTMELLASVALSALLVSGFPAKAASHREAPGIALDPSADNTDVYAFVSYDQANLARAPDDRRVTFIMNVNPGQDPSDGPNYFNFDDNVLYAFHIDNHESGVADDIVYVFTFKTENRPIAAAGNLTSPVPELGNPHIPIPVLQGITALDGPGSEGLTRRQTYTVTEIRNGVPRRLFGDRTLVAVPSNSGPATFPNYPGLAAKGIYIDAPTGMRMFAGQRAETFYIDLGAVFDTLNLRRRLPTLTGPGEDTDSVNPFGVNRFTGFNISTMAIEVPIKHITGDGKPAGSTAYPVIGVYANTARHERRDLIGAERAASGDDWSSDDERRRGNRWVQVSRMANPLVNELIIDTPYKDRWNASHPQDEAQFEAFYKNPTIATALDLVFGVGIKPIDGSPATDRTDLMKILLKYPGQRLAGSHCGSPCSELLRLNLHTPPTAPETQSRLGSAVGTDPAGWPNGRRPNDDVTDIALRVVGGTNYIDAHVGDGVNYLEGAPGVVGVDITANGIARNFPFVPTPYDGKNRRHIDCGEPGANPCGPLVP
jgi:hypothetical protein